MIWRLQLGRQGGAEVAGAADLRDALAGVLRDGDLLLTTDNGTGDRVLRVSPR